jgi:hypothetical protein
MVGGRIHLLKKIERTHRKGKLRVRDVREIVTFGYFPHRLKPDGVYMSQRDESLIILLAECPENLEGRWGKVK